MRLFPKFRADRKKIPTDLQVLQCIYNDYSATYEKFGDEWPPRVHKLYVPVDCDHIANRLGAEGEAIFSRLYHHFNNKYSYENGDGPSVKFFSTVIQNNLGKNINCIHFPYMTTILSGLQDEDKRHRTTVNIALWSLGISIAAFIVSVMATLIG